MIDTESTVSYKLIRAHYKGKRSTRSKMPYMKHIDDGLAVLNYLGASSFTKEAYCIHPILQADASLEKALTYGLVGVEQPVIVLAMEYRNVANRFLSNNTGIVAGADIHLGPLAEVRQMLIADKMSNYIDFDKYVLTNKMGKLLVGNYLALYKYFGLWREALFITDSVFEGCCKAITGPHRRPPVVMTSEESEQFLDDLEDTRVYLGDKASTPTLTATKLTCTQTNKVWNISVQDSLEYPELLLTENRYLPTTEYIQPTYAAELLIELATVMNNSSVCVDSVGSRLRPIKVDAETCLLFNVATSITLNRDGMYILMRALEEYTAICIYWGSDEA